MAHAFLFQNIKKTPWRLICKGTAALSWLNHEVTLYSELSETDSKTVMNFDTIVGLAISSLAVTLALQKVVSRHNNLLICLVAIVWYWTSALWAAVTKEIHVELEHAVLYPSTSIWLTFVPQALSYVLVQIFALVAGVDICKGMSILGTSCSGIWQMAGSAYFFGQLFTVAALALDAPSIVFVVKAIEPLSTALLAIPLLSQTFNLRLFLSILVACSGIMITAMAAHGGFNGIHYSSLYLAMVLGMLANVGFSTRACVAKRALVFESKDPLEAYGKLTVAATQSGLVLLVLWLFVGHSFLDDDGMMSFLQHVRSNPGAWCTASLTYFLYQGSSIFLLNCFFVETHALLVALKHVFVVVLASMLTGAVLNPQMILGLLLVTGGVCWYLSSPEAPASEKEPLLPTKADAVSEHTVSYLLVSVVTSVVVLGTVLPLWRL